MGRRIPVQAIRSDGLLEAFHWYGKLFESSEDVHPLLYLNRHGDIVSIDPGAMGSGDGRFWRSAGTPVKNCRQDLPALDAPSHHIRVSRTITHDGVSWEVSATMIYDQLPIYDVFRKLDDNTVLGVMDNKNIKDPFFFKLSSRPRYLGR